MSLLTQRPPRWSAWLTLALLVALYILSFVDRQILAVLAPQIQADLTLSHFQIGLLYGAAFSFIYAAAGLFMGRLADRWSRRAMIALGALGWSLATLFSGLVSSMAALVVFRLILGLSQATLSPAAYSLLADRFPRSYRATVFSIYASSIFLGLGLSFLVGGSIAQAFDWRVAMIAAGVPGLLLAPLAYVLIGADGRRGEDGDQRPTSEAVAQLQGLLKKPTVRWHLIGFSALACTGYTILAFVATFLTDIVERPDLIPHYGWFLFGVGLTVILSGRLADRLAAADPARRFWMGVVAALGGLPFYALGLFVVDGFAAFLCLGVAVLISSSYNGVAAALIQYFSPPQGRALTGALYLFVISIAGFGLGPPLTGLLMDHLYSGSLAPALAFFTVMIPCSAIATVAFWRAMNTYHDDLASN